MDYVADTHSLVWYFMDDSRFGEKALKAFEQTAQEGYHPVTRIWRSF